MDPGHPPAANPHPDPAAGFQKFCEPAFQPLLILKREAAGDTHNAVSPGSLDSWGRGVGSAAAVAVTSVPNPGHDLQSGVVHSQAWRISLLTDGNCRRCALVFSHMKQLAQDGSG